MSTPKEELRKVMFTKSNVGGNAFESSGYFHKWIEVSQSSEGGGMHVENYGLIESATGEMEEIPPYRVKFVDSDE